MTQTSECTPLYRLVAFGLQNPWVLYGIANGSMSDWCRTCAGKREVIDSPCRNRDAGGDGRCDPGIGCDRCRHTCGDCRGSGLTSAPKLMAQDFGDKESRRIAERLFDVKVADPYSDHGRADITGGHS